MPWFKHIFQFLKKRKKENIQRKINSSIKKCRTEIKRTEKEIDQIHRWMAELIHEIFFCSGRLLVQ